MTEDLQIAIIKQSQESEDPTQFWADVFGMLAGFAQEHIGSAVTAFLMVSMGESVQDDVQSEDRH